MSVAPGPAPSKTTVRRVVLRAIAGIYLVGLWLEAAGCPLPARTLPPSLFYFTEIAALFPYASTGAVDYRAEGWVCSEGNWEEMDVRPYFPLDPDDKENRFQRAVNIYLDTPSVMEGIDAYLVRRHDAGDEADGIERGARIGGVRIVRLRMPIPHLGEPPTHYTRHPLWEAPAIDKQVVYTTPRATMMERCGGAAPEGHP